MVQGLRLHMQEALLRPLMREPEPLCHDEDQVQPNK